MALIRCPDCGNEISDLAPSCPHCGRPRETAPPPPQKARGSNYLRLGCLLLIAFFLFLIYLWTPQGRGSKERAEGAPDEAASMCQGFVKDRLTAPSTAQFPSVYSADTKTDKLGQGHYRVRSYVDAQNSFGAQIRTPYVCEVKKIPDRNEWQLRNLSM